MNCETFVDANTGWVRDPNGVMVCWPCYDAGKMPDFPVDFYADEPEPKPKPKAKRAMKPRVKAVDLMETSTVEGWE
jgi:hypothetical protein